jgi:hypothetical protein
MLGGLLARILLAAFTRHGWDFRVIHEFLVNVWNSGSLLNTYTKGLDYFPGLGQMWFYGSVGTTLVSWPSYFLRNFSAWNPLHVLAGHLPYLLADLMLLVSAVLLLPKTSSARFVRVYWVSPFWIYLNYCYGQIDILGASLALIGTFVAWNVLWSRENSWTTVALRCLLAGVLAGASFHVKIGCFAGTGSLAVMLLYMWSCPKAFSRRNIGTALMSYSVGYICSAALLMWLSVYFFPNYLSAVLGGPTGRLLAPSPIGWPSVWIIPICAFLLFLVYLYLERAQLKRAPIGLLGFGVILSVVGGFYLGICYNPHWIVWSLPVWVTSFCFYERSVSLRVIYGIVIAHAIFVLGFFDSFTSFRTFEIVLEPLGFPLEKAINLWNFSLVPKLSKLTPSGFAASLLFAAAWGAYAIHREYKRGDP